MNREEFLSQLERLLYDIPAQEREEALEYYNGYFDDAGKEKEAEVIQELGSPGKVAAIIKADLSGNEADYEEYTEQGIRMCVLIRKICSKKQIIIIRKKADMDSIHRKNEAVLPGDL